MAIEEQGLAVYLVLGTMNFFSFSTWTGQRAREVSIASGAWGRAGGGVGGCGCGSHARAKSG